MSHPHLPSCQTATSPFFRLSTLLILGFLVLLGCALPASAETLVSTLKIPMYPVPVGQSVHVTVADLADSEEGGLVEIFLIDATGTVVAEMEAHLSKNRAVTLSLSADEDNMSPNQPLLWVRPVIRVTRDLTSDLMTSVSVFQFDPVTLDLDPWCSRVGPSAEDPDPEVNCPGYEQHESTM